MAKRLSILVSGAGIAGLGAAIALSRKGHQVIVVEAELQLPDCGAGIDIPPNSARILQSWGLEDLLSSKVVLPHHKYFRRYATGDLIGKKEINPKMQEMHGFPYCLIHRADYQQILYDAAVEAGAQVLLGMPIKSIDQNSTSVILMNGQEMKADLYVGADGINSTIRSSVLGKSTSIMESTHCRVQVSIPVDSINLDPSISHLMSDVNETQWMGPKRIVIGYPIQGRQEYNLVLTRPGRGPAGKWTEDMSPKTVAIEFENCDPTVRQLLSHATSCSQWNLAFLPPIEKWIWDNGRCVLIGDAAHAMLPTMGQEAATSLEDGAALAECLDRVRALDDLPSVMRAFQDFRKPRCDTISGEASFKAMSATVNTCVDYGLDQEQRDLTMKQEMEGIQMDSFEGKGRSKEENFQRWVYGYDTIKEVNFFLDSRLRRRKWGDGFASRALAQGGFLALD